MKEQETKKRIIVQTPKTRKSTSRIEQHYTKIVSIFVALSVLLIGCIIYFSFSKTTITITATPTDLEETYDIPLADIEGKIFLTDARAEVSISSFSASTERPAKATGTVTIYNNYSQNQPLVATTRLLSTQNVLFRTTETVTVPARGSITVDVVADQEGASGNIAPSRFEIVALSSELKQKIYAESTQKMTGGVVSSTTIGKNDIEQASQDALDAFMSKAQEQFTQELDTRTDLPESVEYSKVLQKEIVVTPSASAGSTAETLNVIAEGTAAIAAYNKNLLLQKLAETITKEMPTGHQLKSSIDPNEVSSALVINAEDGSDALVRIQLTYSTVLNTAHEKLSTKKLVNMTEAKIKSTLLSIKEVSEVKVQFSPFWLKVTPSLEDHIQIKIQY